MKGSSEGGSENFSKTLILSGFILDLISECEISVSFVISNKFSVKQFQKFPALNPRPGICKSRMDKAMIKSGHRGSSGPVRTQGLVIGFRGFKLDSCTACAGVSSWCEFVS